MAKRLSKLPDPERDRAISGQPQLPPKLSVVPDDIDAAEPIMNEDGSATFTAPEKEKKSGDGGFNDNLADDDDFKEDFRGLATKLIELADHDAEAREERDKQYEEGIRRTGMGNDAPGGADFDGASKVVHPMLAEACVDFGSAAMKELCPPGGPVKIALHGQKQDDQTLDKAKRKRDLLNELMTSTMTEYYPEKESMLSQLPLGGSQYEKYLFDDMLGRAKMEFVPIDDIRLPFYASSFESARRRAQLINLTREQVEERIDSGQYIEFSLVNEMDPDQSASKEATDRVQGASPDGYNEDGVRSFLEFSVFQKLDDDTFSEGKYAPYVITVDVSTSKIVACYRNWREDDERMREESWWVEDKFIPWRGAFGIGLPHLIGSLAAAATGSVRALLDSAHINNVAAAVKLKGGRASGENITVSPTEVAEITAPPNVDDIRKLIMPLPFNPPSAVLFQLLGWLTDTAKGVVGTAEEKIADVSSQMPVGTAMALIEQGSKVFSQIHSRLHRSQARGIKILCRLVHDYPIGEHEILLKKYGLTPEDFATDSGIEPVSDPNIFSEAQRYAQWQAVMQMAAADAQNQQIPWNQTQLRRQGLELLRYPDVDSVLPKAPDPISADPVTENYQTLLTGVPLKATDDQDHVSHLHEHLRFIMDPMGGAGPMFTGQQLQSILANCTQHVLMMYASSAKAAGGALAQQAQTNAQPGMSQQPQNPETLAAGAAAAASQMLQQEHGELAQNLNAAFQLVQKKMPPQPTDPVSATLQAAMAETSRRAQSDQATAAYNQDKLKQDAELAAQTLQSKEQQFMQKLQDDMQKFQQELMFEIKQAADKHSIDLGALQASFDNINLKYMQLQQDFQNANAANEERVRELQQAQQEVPAETPQSPASAPDLSPQLDAHMQALKEMMETVRQLHSQKRHNRVTRDANGDLVASYDPRLDNNDGTTSLN